MNLPLPHNPDEFLGTIPVHLSVIAASPTNPRTVFNEPEMVELTDSVKKHGVLQPILLRPWPDEYPHAEPRPIYEIVAGERRWRAATRAELGIIEAKVRDLSTMEVLEIQIIENLQRADLHPLEEAIGYERMMQEYGYSADTLADKVHKSKAYIYARIKLTALCYDARKAFYSGKLNPSTALLIARIPNEALQIKATREITDPDYGGEGMSVRNAQRHLQRNYMLRLVEAPFDLYDDMLIKGAGSCEHCPKRTGNQPADLFADVQSADVCTDPECHAEKRDAHTKNVAAAATARGQTVITGKAAEKLMPYSNSLDYQSGMVLLDSKCYEDPEQRTYREILQGHQVETQLVQNHHRGTLEEIVPKTQLAEAFKAAGIKAEKSYNASAEREKEKAKIKLENEYRERLFDTVREELAKSFNGGGPEFTTPELRMLARSMFARIYNPKALKKLSGIWMPGQKVDENEFRELIVEMEPTNLCLLMLDICMAVEIDSNWPGSTQNLTETAARLSIDPAEIRKQVEAEAKKTAPTPKKAAQAKKSSAPEKQSEAPDLKVGDCVRIKCTPPRNIDGREGVIETIDGELGAGGTIKVRTGPGDDGLIWNLFWNELEKLPPATQAAPAQDQNPAGAEAGKAQKESAVADMEEQEKVVRTSPAEQIETVLEG